jgi:hypothetical protein
VFPGQGHPDVVQLLNLGPEFHPLEPRVTEGKDNPVNNQKLY